MATAPRFVNLQSSPVGVYTPEKRKVYIQPFANQKFSTEKTDVFVVEGEHYRQYVAPVGPLACFPEAATAPVAVAEREVPTGPVAGAKPESSAGDSAPAAGAPAAPAAAPAGAGASDGKTAGAGDAASTPAKPDAAKLTTDPAKVSGAGTVTPKAPTTPKRK